MTLVFATYGLIDPSALAIIQVASMTGQIFQSVIFGFGNGASVVVEETLGRRCVDEAVEHSSRTIRIALVMIVIMVAGIISVINPVSELYGFGAETTLLLKKTIAVYAFTMMPRMMSYVLQIYNFVRDDVLFGYNADDNISASKIYSSASHPPRHKFLFAPATKYVRI